MHKEPPLPKDRNQTIRQEIINLLKEAPMTAKEISKAVGIAEKDIYSHLMHIALTMKGSFRAEPPVCKKCGFVFRKRQKPTKPGRCPLCKGESITMPVFSLKKDEG